MWSLSNQLSSAQLPLGMAPPVVVSRSRKEKHQTLAVGQKKLMVEERSPTYVTYKLTYQY
jgi:hypothetical protein